MAIYLKKQEVAERVGKGFVTKDGVVDGKAYNIYRANGIDICDPDFNKTIKCVITILNSMEKNGEGIELYPKDIRGIRLHDIRKQQGKSGSWVAIKAGVSKTTIYDIENGLTIPRPSTLAKIAKALNISLEELS